MRNDTTNPEIDSEDAPTYTSIRAFAAAIPRSHSTLSRWMSREDWPADVATTGPWHQADVERVRQWADETLEPDRTGHHTPVDDGDGFYRRVSHAVARWKMPKNDMGLESRDAANYPKAFCGNGERAILAGTYQLTSTEARRLALSFMRFRAIMVDMAEWMPGWLVRKDKDEIERRLRAEIYMRCGWATEALDAIARGDTWLDTDDKGNAIRRDRDGNEVPEDDQGEE